MTELKIGPQHPVTQGFIITLFTQGDKIIKVELGIGYLHRGIEKILENLNYIQGIILSHKIDNIDSFSYSLSYVLAIERLIGIEPPLRGQYIRVIFSELSRISSHLFWLRRFLNNLGFYLPSLYALREWKKLIDLIEEIAPRGSLFLRIGGVSRNLTSGWIKKLSGFLEDLERNIYQIEKIVYDNEIFILRTKGIGIINPPLALELSLTGPLLRCCGIAWDIRKVFPYSSYKDFNFKIPVGENGDSYDRFFVRIEEIKESINIIRQAIKNLPSGEIILKDFDFIPPEKISNFKLLREGIRVKEGEVYTSVESARGELGFFIVSKGSTKPYRVRIRTPSFYNLQVLEYILPGNSISDSMVIIGSIDISPFEVDR